MGMFHDLDIANAADDPGSIPSDMYDLIVSDVKVGEKSDKDKSKEYTVFVFAIVGGKYHGRELQDWKWVPENGDTSSEAEDALAYLKQRMTQFGIPLSEMNNVGPDDLKGIELTGELVKKGQYTNIAFGENALRLRNSSAGVDTSESSNGGGLNEFLPSA